MKKVIACLLLYAPLAAQQGQINNNVATPPPKDPKTMTEYTSSLLTMKCVETHLIADKVHGGTDYGAAITAAVQASPLTTVTDLRICAGGDHPVYTTAILDRPISLWGYGSRLIPQSSMSSAPVLTRATATAGSQIVTVDSADGLSVGMAVGGIGIPPGAYVTEIKGTAVTISIPAHLQFYGIATKDSPTIRGVSSMSGIEIGQVINGRGSWPFIPGETAIRAINYAANSITVSTPALSGSTVPNTYVIEGRWKTNLTFVVTKPVLSWVFNTQALHNDYSQMIGASMHGIWIADPAKRSLSGVQGVQIAGYDGFNSYDLRVDDIASSAEILGGYTGNLLRNQYSPVRESSFINDQIRNSGDAHTGQAALAIMTPYEGNLSEADEINQIDFVGGHYVCSNGIAIAIGSYNRNHISANPTNGPRLIWFDTNYQVEGCAITFDIPAQSDSIYIENAGDIHFDGGEIAITGQGKALIRVDNGIAITSANSYLSSQGIPKSYVVNAVTGSPTVTYVNGGGGLIPFNTTQTWDGIAALIDDKAVHLAPLSPVAADGRSLKLSSPWTGSTGTYSMTLGYGGVYIESSGLLKQVSFRPNYIVGSDPQSLKFLNITDSAKNLYVGTALFGSDDQNTQDDFNGTRITQGPTQFSSTFKPDTTKQGVVTSWTLNRAGEADIVNVKGGGSGGWCLFNVAVNEPIGNPSNCFSGTGGLSLRDKLTVTLTQDNDGIRLTPFSDTSKHFDVYGTDSNNKTVNWSIARTGALFPKVNSIGGYSLNGVAGFTGTKKVGSCVFRIEGGIITDVTGC